MRKILCLAFMPCLFMMACKEMPTSPASPNLGMALPNVIAFTVDNATPLYKEKITLTYNVGNAAFMQISSDVRGVLQAHGDPNSTAASNWSGSLNWSAKDSEVISLSAENKTGNAYAEIGITVVSRAWLTQSIRGYIAIKSDRLEMQFWNEGNLTAFNIIGIVSVFDGSGSFLQRIETRHDGDVGPGEPILLVWPYPPEIYGRVQSQSLTSLIYDQK